MTLSADDHRAIQARAMGDFIALLGAASPGAHLFERPGVAGAVVPAAPDRSIVNSAIVAGPADLAAAYDELAADHAESGVDAWTVWVPEDDRESIELLTERGHAFDGQPMAMVLELDSFEPGRLPDAAELDLDWDDEASFADLGMINDEAYGLTPQNGLARAVVTRPPGFDCRLYRARVDGELASVVMTIDHVDDLGIYLVATPPPFRGRGLAGGLMRVALEAAGERGLRTSSLQASKAGEPVYERLGYEPGFRFHLYEWRAGRS